MWSKVWSKLLQRQLEYGLENSMLLISNRFYLRVQFLESKSKHKISNIVFNNKKRKQYKWDNAFFFYFDSLN